ncbi:MAG: glycoside hydrolase family 6 protein [Aeromicrobium sp.]
MNLGRRISRISIVVLVAALSVGLLSAPAEAGKKKDVRLSRSFFVDPTTSAAKAAKNDRRFAPIGKRSQSLWLTDYYSVGTVKKAASTYAKRASRKKKTPVVTIYAIPDRDCGNHSSGGFDAATYKRWITKVAAGLKGRKAIAVLEPDAIALQGSAQCTADSDRSALLSYAARKLHAAGVWVYIDAGHSSWQSPDVMASRLVAAGVKKYARGFSVNVGNYQTTSAERAYGNQVVDALRRQGAGAKHFVIDTSRNGAATPPAAGDFCNPLGQRIGSSADRPRMVRKGSLDAYLWVKNPGESDGPCNGGPAAGQWWPQGALRLLGKA